MRTLISMPLVPQTLEEYPADGLTRLCRAFGCDGLEGVWGGGAMPAGIPAELRVGYHLTFYPDWLDFWRENRAALTRKFGSEAAWTAFYGGRDGRETLLTLYRADLERALAWGAEYVVFHVSDISIEEGYTYRWLHSSEEVIDGAAEVLNLLLGGRKLPFALLLENQWWPGLTFTEPTLTARLLERVDYPNMGIMLDTGHLMNANPDLTTQEEGADWVHRMLDAHGSLCRYIRGVHLHQSLSGPYVHTHTGHLPPLPEDYLERFSVSYRHILRIDTHSPWTHPAIRGLVERVAPDYLVHELSASCRTDLEHALALQTQALGDR